MVTHNLRAAYGDCMITLRDGRIVDEVRTRQPATVTPLRGR